MCACVRAYVCVCARVHMRVCVCDGPIVRSGVYEI